MAERADITIYTTALCGYCRAAKELLRRKGAVFTEIDVSFDPESRRQMTTRAHGRYTVPQIFIGDTHVGGFAELYTLDSRGELDRLLDGSRQTA